MKQRSAPRAARRLLLLGWCVAAVYVIELAWFGGDAPLAGNGVLSFLSEVVPAAACCVAAFGARGRRSEALLVASGVAAYATGNILLTIIGSDQQYVPFPNISDAFYLLFFPAVISALILGMRREHPRFQASAAWDTAVGALGLATVLAVLLRAVFEQIGGNEWQVAVAVAYPLCDTLLIAAVVGVACMHDGRLPRQWLPLMAGLTVFTIADVVYALRVSADGYELGTPLDAMWSVGLTLVSTWAVRQASGSRTRREAPPLRTAAPLVVPALAEVAALAVLLAAAQGLVSQPAVALAVLTGLVAAGRTHVAYRALSRMPELTRLSRTDDLTGLANRRAFYHHAGRRLSRSPATVALLLVDLDGFKQVNDRLGHHLGDQLLVETGVRLSDELRSGDLVARLGGDEFVVIAEVPDAASATRLADKLRTALTTPFDLAGTTVRIDASIGVAVNDRHGEDAHQLLRRADAAMYLTKSRRRGSGTAENHDVVRGRDQHPLIARASTTRTRPP